MKKLGRIIVLALGIAPALVPAQTVAFLSGETTDGMNRICFYDSVKGRVAITIPITSMCPLSINL